MNRMEPKPIQQNADLPYEWDRGPHSRLVSPKVYGWCRCMRFWEYQPPEVCPNCGKERNEER